MSAVPPVTPPPAPAPEKKKRSPLVWVLAGCGGVLVVAVLVMIVAAVFVGKKVKDFAGEMEKNPTIAAAKLVAQLNPDVEVVSTDEDAGTITLRNLKTGEIMTFDASKVKEGKISFRSGEGEEVTFQARGDEDEGSMTVESKKGTMTFGAGTEVDIPDWIPEYAGAEVDGQFGADTPEGRTGTFSFETGDGADEVMRFYQQALEKEGFSVDRSTFERNGEVAGGMLSARDDGRSLTVSVSTEDGTTQVSVGFQVKTPASVDEE